MTATLVEVRKIAEKYFSDIVYIDDALKKPDDILNELVNFGAELSATSESQSLNKGEEKVVSIRPRPRKADKAVVEQSDNMGGEAIDQTVATPQTKWVDYKKAFDLIYDFQKVGCKVSPYYFDNGAESFEMATALVEKSHLTILDWELDEKKGETTIALLKSALSNENRMKLIVIYTNNRIDAFNQIDSEFDATPKRKDLNNGGEIDYFKFENSLLMVCDKLYFDASTIFQLFIDLLVEEFGLFPFVFFDAMNKITDGTATILNRFSYPFENALMLQLHSTGLGENSEYATILSKMVTNHINEVVDIDPKILDCIVSNWVTKVDEIIQLNDNDLRVRIHTFLDDLISRQNTNPAGELNKEIMSNMKLLSVASWRESLQKFKRQKKLYNPNADTNFSEYILKKFVEVVVEKRYSELERTLGEGAKGEAFERLKAEFWSVSQASIRLKYKEPLFRLLPSMYIYLLSREFEVNKLIRSQVELVRLMKLISYEENERTISPKGKAVNYFKTGDILHGEGRYLMCISPSCDTFRPKKVGYQLKFLIGERVKEDSLQQLKHSEHLSILPNPEKDGELICIKWNCSRTTVIDISNEKSQIKRYSRPYRFDSTYCQQIINKYIAYHSRAGVDELHIKEHASSRNLFINETKLAKIAPDVYHLFIQRLLN